MFANTTLVQNTVGGGYLPALVDKNGWNWFYSIKTEWEQSLVFKSGNIGFLILVCGMGTKIQIRVFLKTI
jgi:hypothetical protein